MPTKTPYSQGQFCWVDLMAHDAAAAKNFYGELFGWQSEDQDTHGGPPYSIFTLDKQQVAGMGEMNDEMKASGRPPVWSSYVDVDDADSVTKKADELGANIIMEPMQVVDAGRMAILQDPTGAFLSLWQPLAHCGAQIVNAPNSWVWNELMTRDPASALKFYGDLFGWEFAKEETGTAAYWNFKLNGRMNGGMLEMTSEMGEIPPHWSVYFAVADIHASTEKLQQLGGRILRPPFEVSVGHICVAMDSQGAAFNLIQMTVPIDE